MDPFIEAQYVYERDSFFYLLNKVRLEIALSELKNEQKAYQGMRFLFQNAELNYEARQTATAYLRLYHRDLNRLPTDQEIAFDGQHYTIHYLDLLIK